VSPSPVQAGEQIEVVARCAGGSTSASVSATTLGGSSNVPMLESYANPSEWMATLTIPAETRPGTYNVGGTCGNGGDFRATVVVATTAGPMGGGGWAQRGAYGWLFVAGSAMLVVAAVGGVVLLRRPTP
jgi:hypothetical protein